MNTAKLEVLVVGATGSIGRLVVAEALRAGHAVRALVRDRCRAGSIPPAAELMVGDLTEAKSLTAAVDGIDAVVFTHGTSRGGKSEAERVDYGAVRNVLEALCGRSVRISLMTAIGVTHREGAYNCSTQIHDWKRRGERLVRGSGLPYTIVRPGWFDYNAPDQQRLVFLQGDRRRAGDPSDGIVSRQQIAEVLVRSLTSAAADGKSFELVAEQGVASLDLEPLFAALDGDIPGSVDAAHDEANMPLATEPSSVRDDVARFAPRVATPSKETTGEMI
jgi:uncharacterized protein YbjT (DUF2867 family)